MKKNLNLILFSFLLVFITGGHSFAGDIDDFLILDYAESEQCALYVGDIKSFTAYTPERVTINNPEIADISSVSETEIVIVAKAAGTTSLTWNDEQGKHSVNLNVIFENISFIKEQINNLLKIVDLPDVYTKEAKNESRVILLGKVKSEEKMHRMNTVLKAYSAKIINLVSIEDTEESVQIEIKILEIKRDSAKNLGIEWPTGATLTEPTGRWNTLSSIPDAFYRIGDWTKNSFTATVNFLIQNGSARILSQPRLVCQSGKEATLLVGGEVPILTTQISSSGDSGTSVEYKEYGIKLLINPIVTETEKIKLSLQVDVSDIETAVILGTVASPSAKAYPLTKRTTSTELFLNDGQTLIIGGLIKQKSQETLKKMPFLGDIPLLGMFFRNSDITGGGGAGQLADTELVISLTPTLLNKKGLPGKQQTYFADPVKKASSSKKDTYPKSKLSLDAYAQTIIQKIVDNLEYPLEAKKLSLEGSLKLALLLSSKGKVLDAKITKSSGYQILDENALKTAKQIIAYPPSPSGIRKKELWIDIPIIYNLN